MLYVSGEQFTNEFINALQERKTKEFRNKYRSVDMLLIDDIHFITGKAQTEECFFHTFNELHNNNRQIVITSDHSPKALSLSDERLSSRFQWGLTVDIQPPSFETRLAILETKAKRKGQDISSDALEFIAHQIKQNIRELEGSLNRVIAYAKLLKSLVTPELAALALENIADKPTRGSALTPALLLEAVANSFQMTSADLKGRKRDKETALARQVVMYLLRQETNSSLALIGKELGNRNPATVGHACEKIASSINASPYLMRKIAEIREEVLPKPKSKHNK